MNHEMKRAVVATLLKAGRRDLATTFAANGINTDVLIAKVIDLLDRHDIELKDSYVSDDRSVLKFDGSFGKHVKEQHLKDVGELAGEPFRLDVVIDAGNHITVTVTTERFNQSRSYTLRRRDLATVFAMIEKATTEIMEHFAA